MSSVIQAAYLIVLVNDEVWGMIDDRTLKISWYL